MAVLVLGGYGLIGSAVVERLCSQGVPVIGLGRHPDAARLRWPQSTWRQADIATLLRPEDWSALLAGVDVVVNAAGALQQGLRDDVAKVQLDAMTALYLAARAAGVRRIVQVSAAGAAPDAALDFFRMKGLADKALRESGLDHVILRPGLVISPTAYGGTALLRALAAFPLVTPLVMASRPIQTVWIDDLAEAVAVAASERAVSEATLDLVEAPQRSLADTVRLLRGWLGLREAPIIRFPRMVAILVGGVADALGWLGWRSPLRSTAMAVVRSGVVGDAALAPALIGRPLKTLPEALRLMPVGVQEVWFARLWLLKPLVFGGLAAFWAASGTIALTRWWAAVEILTERGMSQGLAVTSVGVGAGVDIALGAAVLFRPTADWALRGMILVSLGYMVGGAVVAPDLWLDPLGPMVKIFPVALLAMVGLAIVDER